MVYSPADEDLVALVKSVKAGTTVKSGVANKDWHTPYIDVGILLSTQNRAEGYHLKDIRIVDLHTSIPADESGNFDLGRYIAYSSYQDLREDSILVIKYPSDRIKGQNEMPESLLKEATSANVAWGFDVWVASIRHCDNDNYVLEILKTLETRGIEAVKARYFGPAEDNNIIDPAANDNSCAGKYPGQ